MRTDRRTAEAIAADMLDYCDHLTTLEEEFLAFDAARRLAVAIRKHACDERQSYDALTAIITAVGLECGRLAHDVIISLAPKGERT